MQSRYPRLEFCEFNCIGVRFPELISLKLCTMDWIKLLVIELATSNRSALFQHSIVTIAKLDVYHLGRWNPQRHFEQANLIL